MPSDLHFLHEIGSATENISGKQDEIVNVLCLHFLSLTIELLKAVSMHYNSEFTTNASKVGTQQLWLIKYKKN